MNHKINALLNKDKGIFLALDQGLEHGPKDFSSTTINPANAFNLAKEGNFNAIILQRGLAKKYHENYKYKIPLILKLNGKTSMSPSDQHAAETCSVNRAVKLGADAVGYTIYFGSYHENSMIKEFSKIEEEAHDHGLPVVVWACPKGKGIDETNTNVLAYAARASLELGADFIKMKYNGDAEGYKWVVKSSGNAKLFIDSGEKTDPKNLLVDAYNQMKAGTSGVVLGKNIWQSNMPLKVANALKAVVFGGKTVDQALKLVRK